METIENLSNSKEIPSEEMFEYLLVNVPKYYLFERKLFTFARHFVHGYNGGSWSCMEIICNGEKGFFMLLNGDDVEYNVDNSMNGSSATLTRLQMSVFLNLMAFSHTSFDCQDFGEYYHILNDYVSIEFKDDNNFLSDLSRLLD